MMDQDEAMFGTEVKQKPKKKINLTKWFALGLGGVLGLSHVGMIGMISRKDGLPDLDIPVGPLHIIRSLSRQRGIQDQLHCK